MRVIRSIVTEEITIIIPPEERYLAERILQGVIKLYEEEGCNMSSVADMLLIMKENVITIQ